ncbi:DUF2637 domain-containing protein [Kitasatospora sp. NPDC048545]|uniref:DUF2637 domain-containing protein n=1 Tax=Kitasatospora sp. NPDC048545 TaxID=3157208 RepID=UPI0033D9611B
MSETGETLTGMSRWDKAAIGVMGAVGGALSYDALQQMAVAMHVRPQLSYLFPVAIDGFIAYGVRALVVLKEAPLRARAYTWSVFGASTATSVWANWTHAVRLNEATAQAPGLHLTNTAVGALSTIAPLVLGGATHLYIVISRHAPGRGGQEPLAAPAPQPSRFTRWWVRTRDHDSAPGAEPRRIEERGRDREITAVPTAAPVVQAEPAAPEAVPVPPAPAVTNPGTTPQQGTVPADAVLGAGTGREPTPQAVSPVPAPSAGRAPGTVPSGTEAPVSVPTPSAPNRGTAEPAPDTEAGRDSGPTEDKPGLRPAADASGPALPGTADSAGTAAQSVGRAVAAGPEAKTGTVPASGRSGDGPRPEAAGPATTPVVVAAPAPVRAQAPVPVPRSVPDHSSTPAANRRRQLSSTELQELVPIARKAAAEAEGRLNRDALRAGFKAQNIPINNVALGQLLRELREIDGGKPPPARR